MPESQLNHRTGARMVRAITAVLAAAIGAMGCHLAELVEPTVTVAVVNRTTDSLTVFAARPESIDDPNPEFEGVRPDRLIPPGGGRFFPESEISGYTRGSRVMLLVYQVRGSTQRLAQLKILEPERLRSTELVLTIECDPPGAGTRLCQ